MTLLWIPLAAGLAAADVPSNLPDRIADARAAGAVVPGVEDAPWSQTLAAQVVEAERDEPALAALVATVPPVRTRAGTLRFTDASLLAPDAAPLLLARLVTAEADTAERVALVGAAARSTGSWAPTVAALVPLETDPAVRRMLVEVLAQAPLEVAAPALEAAAGDAAAPVRAAAARAIGGHPDGLALHDLLARLLDDAAPAVRAEAARSAGWLGAATLWGALAARVEDDEAAVRLRAIRALQRLDPTRAAGLSAIAAATRDRNAKVARAAQQVRAAR